MIGVPTDRAGESAIPNPLESAALARPHHPALVTDEGCWSYEELRDAVGRLAARLAACQVGPGRRVALLGAASAQWVIAAHGIGWCGATLIPLPAEQPSRELQAALAKSAPDLVVRVGSNQELNGFAVVDAEELTGGNEIRERFWPWDEPRVTMLTSGTSGDRQAVDLTTAQLVMSAFGSMIRLGHQLDDRWLLCLPLHHIGGFSILIRAALGAITVVLHRRFVAARVAQAMDCGDLTLASFVPTMMERILDVRDERPFPASLRAIVLGGAKVSDDLLERCREIRAPVALTWGMTEAASQISMRFFGDCDSEHGSGAPMPFARVCAAEAGNLVVYSPTVRGVYPTRDLGYVDGDHRVHVTGRCDDTIVSGGENIVPSDVEAVLLAHPGVDDAVVVGRPDVRWGERPVALLVASGEGSVPDAELRAWCREHLAGFKVPDHYIWVNAIPLGPLGKRPRRQALLLAAKLAPELFDVRDRDERAQCDEQLFGHLTTGECLSIHRTVDQGGDRFRPVLRVDDTVVKTQRPMTAFGQRDHDAKVLAVDDGSFEIGLSVHKRQSPPGLGAGSGKGVRGVIEGSGEQLLKRLVAVLKNSTEEHDSGLVNFVEARDQRMFKNHRNTLQAA